MDVALEEERVMSETIKGEGPRELAERQDRGQTPELVRSTDKATKSKRRGLARRLAWAFVSVAAGLLLVTGLALTFVSYNAQVEQIIVRQQKTADGAALLTSRYLTRARDTLRIHAEAASGYGLLLRPLETQVSELEAIRASSGEMFQQIILVDDEGIEQAKVPHSEGYGLEDLGSQADSLAFQRALEGEVFVDTQTQMLSGATFPVLAMAAPIPARAGSERRGVLMAQVSVQDMWDAVAQVEVGETGYAYIVNRDTGELFVHSDPERFEQQPGDSLAQVPAVAQIMDSEIRGTEQDIQHQYEGLDGVPVIGAASPLPEPDLTLVVELPTSEGLASLRQMLYLLVVLIVVGAVVAGSLGLLIPQRIVQPLLTLQQGAQEIGAGELDRVIQVETGDEIQDLAEAFNQMAANLKASQTELEQWGHELETKVEERTRELADASGKMQRRAIQLEASAEVARAIASVRDLDVLLGQVTRSISERFGWYHVGVFLLDRSEEYAVLQAASSEGGQRMLARGHRLKVGESGIVGFVTGAREPRIALDVGQDAVFFDNPDLPRTRSEMALPLAVGGRVIGALDVQSTEPAAYDDEDVALLRILADQVAIAIENVRLFERTQQALREVEAIHRQYIEREWAKEAAERHDLAYEYRRRGVPPLDDAWTPELSEALSGGEVVASRADNPSWGDGHAKAALAAPIKYRDQVIGVLDLQETAESRQWTEDEITLVQAISDQVGLALENARLFADTQRRAEELAAINRIGLSVNSDLDLTGVLSALYRELRRILDVESFYVALYDANSGMLEFPLMIGEEGPIKLEPQYMDESPGVTGYVIQSRQALHLSDLRAVPEDAPYQVIDVDEEPTRSYIGVPLISRDRVIGVLSVQSSQPGAYSEEDVELLTTIATQASTAIENARAYERLTETAEELREIDRFKTQFLANMSHELRTPLNSIIGFSRVMLKGIDGPLTESQETDLGSIYNSGQHLLALINSILDMSKIEAGKMELSFEEVRLPDVLSAVLGTTHALVKDKPVELHSDIPDDLPTVWADTQRVRQVLLNLMSNAAKFTEEGYISVRAEAGEEFVTITCEDTGVGIEPDAQTRLFIPFQQVDGSTTRRAGGTGLGLAISRSFVEMLGGEIWVESEPDKGSTFGFTLPIYQVLHEKQEQAAEFQLDPDKKAILAIDDDPGVITLLRRYLESDGYQVVGVTEALHAVPAARRLASDLTAITLDVVMPNTDGWQILRTLRQDPQTREIPVVLCSIVEGLDHGLKLGAADCLQKPITRHELLESLRRVERRAFKFD
jgi:signal transduction histidine kinase/CheY-like chemotaxis protein